MTLCSPSQCIGNCRQHVMHLNIQLTHCRSAVHTRLSQIFTFSWIWVKLLESWTHSTTAYSIHIYPKQTWLISRGNLLFTWELWFLKIFVQGLPMVHFVDDDMIMVLVWCHHFLWRGWFFSIKDFTVPFNENFEKSYLGIEWTYPISVLSKFWMFKLLITILHLIRFTFFSEYSV